MLGLPWERRFRSMISNVYACLARPSSFCLFFGSVPSVVVNQLLSIFQTATHTRTKGGLIQVSASCDVHINYHIVTSNTDRWQPGFTRASRQGDRTWICRVTGIVIYDRSCRAHQHAHILHIIRSDIIGYRGNAFNLEIVSRFYYTPSFSWRCV